MMFSKLVLGFIKRVLDSNEAIDEIINSYTYSERFIIAIDFQMMHKTITCDILEKTYANAALNHDPLMGLSFLKQINNSKEVLAKIANYYDEGQRCHIGISIFNIQEKLLSEVERFLGEEVDPDVSKTVNLNETNH